MLAVLLRVTPRPHPVPRHLAPLLLGFLHPAGEYWTTGSELWGCSYLLTWTPVCSDAHWAVLARHCPCRYFQEWFWCQALCPYNFQGKISESYLSLGLRWEANSPLSCSRQAAQDTKASVIVTLAWRFPVDPYKCSKFPVILDSTRPPFLPSFFFSPTNNWICRFEGFSHLPWLPAKCSSKSFTLINLLLT